MNLLYNLSIKSLLLAFTLLFSTHALQSQSVVINEVMASNGDTYADEDGDYEDWVELYNAGDEAVELSGWGLSDDYDRPFRWVFPYGVEIEAGAYMLIWASNKNRNHAAGELHTNYAISSSGEEVILTRPDGERMDEVAPRPIPRDISWGRYPDGTDNWFYFENATPAAANTNPSYSGIVEPPSFSHSPGFYTDSFLLEITHPDTNVTIYYTTDGSTPTTDSEIYTGPIDIYDRSGEENVFSMIRTNVWPSGNARGWNPPVGLINKGTPLRVKVVRDGDMPALKDESFFVFGEGFEKYPLPVFSIITEPDNLFDDTIGLFVPGIHHDPSNDRTGNYRQRGREWEREAKMTFFDDGEIAFSQNVGLRIHGGYSRLFPQKSLRVYARGGYGESYINYDLFQNGEYDAYRRFILRHSGNDWNLSMMRDGTIQDVWQAVGMEGQNFRPTVVFINGEFWGIHNIRERQDKHYLKRKFGVEEDEIDVLTRNKHVKEGDSLHYQTLIDFVDNNDMTDDENLDHVNTKMDLENFMDYYSLQVYCGNTDWPHNNIDYWRKRVDYDPEAPYGHDGRWRWLVYDLDRCLGYSSVHTNMINWIHSPNGNNRGAWATLLYRRLQENERFRYLFINRMANHLNSTFVPERVVDYVDKNQDRIIDVIGEHIHRWRRPNNMGTWNSQANNMRNFANQRPDVVRNHIRSRFQISSNIDLTLDVNNSDYGTVHLNSLTINSELPGVDPAAPYPWTGVYFQDIPVDLEAEARTGYIFDYWTIEGDTVHDQSLSMAFQSDVEIVAHYSIDTTYEYLPEPYEPGPCAYLFDYWNESAEVGTFPENMAFVYMEEEEPGLDSDIGGFTEGVYNLDSRTRINGLGEDGFSFINTGNSDGNPGYPGRQLGGALLGLSTLGEDELFVRWEGGTVMPNSRVYNLRLQYRIGDSGPFQDLTDRNGQPVEYLRNEEEGHSEVIGPVALPEEVMDLPYVQMLWRYYYTGERLDEDSGARDQLRVGHIVVSSDSAALETYQASDFLPEVELVKTDVCFDSTSLGTLSVEVLSGIPNLLWVVEEDTSVAATDIILSYPVGTHDYGLIDGLGCKSTGTFNIQFSEEISIDWDYESPTCVGDSDGSITASVSGGTDPLEYVWSTGQESGEGGTFTLWDFNGLVPSDSPPPTLGEGTATLVGGTNNPQTGTSGDGSSDPAADNDAWQTTGYPSQGENPRTAGVQFDISTEGYRDIVFSFDQRLSSTAANTWVLLYTTDHTADSVIWEEATVFRIEPQMTGTGDTWHNQRTHDFSGVQDLNDNPHAAFRIVSDFDPETGQYESARLDRNYSTQGTARFDMVGVHGAPINRQTTLSDIPAGMYSITVTDALGCMTADTFELVDPDSVPIPVITGPVEVEAGQTSTYLVEASGGIDINLFFDIEGGVLDTVIDDKEIVILWDEIPPGEIVEGSITATYTDFLGCSAEYTLPIEIMGPTSTQDLQNQIEVNVFPNPNRGEFTVEVDYPDFGQDWTLELYSATGALLRKSQLKSDQLQFTMESSYRGAVNLVLRDGRGVVRYRNVVLVF